MTDHPERIETTTETLKVALDEATMEAQRIRLRRPVRPSFRQWFYQTFGPKSQISPWKAVLLVVFVLVPMLVVFVLVPMLAFVLIRDAFVSVFRLKKSRIPG